MAARTLSNSLEMVLTVIALNYWPIDGTVAYANGAWIRYFFKPRLYHDACSTGRK
jgi:hypothetical protein